MASETNESGPRLRSDAARNVERITVAASEAFAEHGLEVTMADVAERAGVGVGTVYRRFGDKAGLVDALFTSQVDAVVMSMDAVSRAEDPATSFVDHLAELCAQLAENKGLRQIVLQEVRSPGAAQSAALERIIPASDVMVDRLKELGWMRQSFHGADVPLILAAVGAARELGGAAHPALWRRTLRLMVDGMRQDSRIPADIADVPEPAAPQPQTGI
ncbi:TetR/AcrR family transcriptional regulator [Gordonia desulfuricans]|uniref:TetR/AcrR family transcriptional regulator n=1 Tax=Gordonia desulfuricans TaxID=89051 RepID=A0A7K3LS28_9ACTN|nr:TetR/AcrR family transcriptional regulator [Gordonia desulfuricans]NDK91085.1 TetR/AcrR family transcriptional regulator [Gordonia desulfuricans]